MKKHSLGTIVFSHGNSFPAGTYRVLFEGWRAAGYTVHAIDKYGHDPQYPVTDRWPRLRDQLIHFAEAQADGPAFFVGHSLGGFLSVLAAAKRPELARAVLMLDSPLVGGVLSPAIRIAKLTGLGARFSPGAISKARRTHFPTVEAAHAHFSGKQAFARWDPQVLRDYIDSGIEPSQTPGYKGYELSFRREVETDIYNTIPHDFPRYLRRYPLRCPAAFIGGTESNEVRRVGMGATERVVQGHVSWIAGSHLYPLEHPQKTVAESLKWLAVLAKASASV